MIFFVLVFLITIGLFLLFTDVYIVRTKISDDEPKPPSNPEDYLDYLREQLIELKRDINQKDEKILTLDSRVEELEHEVDSIRQEVAEAITKYISKVNDD